MPRSFEARFALVDELVFEVGSSIELARIWRHEGFADALGVGSARDLRTEFVEIPTGAFRMGADEDQVRAWSEWREGARTFLGDHEHPAVHVSIDEPFLIARLPATQSLWDALVAVGIDAWDQRNVEGEWLPVTGVSWTSLRPVLDATGCRLPSEAEWEYACRAGTDTTFFHGDLEFGLRDYAWFKGAGPSTVTSRKPNAFGLHDMLGNVWEWCEDAWHPTHQGHHGTQSPRGPDDAAERVLRGGSYLSRSAPMVASAIRSFAGWMSHADDVGVRLAAAGPQTKSPAG